MRSPITEKWLREEEAKANSLRATLNVDLFGGVGDDGHVAVGIAVDRDLGDGDRRFTLRLGIAAFLADVEDRNGDAGTDQQAKTKQNKDNIHRLKVFLAAKIEKMLNNGDDGKTKFNSRRE